MCYLLAYWGVKDSLRGPRDQKAVCSESIKHLLIN